MAYSGTVGTTVINVSKLIDHGARRCGKLAEELTSEQLLSARESLFFFLSHLANIGINYWAINKTVIGLNADQYQYTLPLGAIDVLQALYRTADRPTPAVGGGYFGSSGVIANAFDGAIQTICQQSAPNGNLGINYGPQNPTYIGTVGILPGTSGSFHVVIEYSFDGVTWNTLYDPGTTTWVDDQWLWYDIDPGYTCSWYRIRETSGNTLAVRELYFGDNTREIQMSRLNRDDYTNLPNKQFTANQPFQFWFNRTLPAPTIVLWPVPNDPFVQMTVWYSRQIMDVGDLTNQLEIPQRWYEAVLMNLSHRMSLELPNVPMDRVLYLEKMAQQYLFEAEQEERDKSPLYFAPNISPYTR